MSPSVPSRYGSTGPPKLDRRAVLRLWGGVACMAVLIGIAAWVSRAGAGPTAAVRNGPAATAATWTGDMTEFTRQPTAAPGPVSNEADMAFDRSRGVVVLWDHGCSRLVMGFTGGCQGQVDQTWTWQGRGWHDQHAATSPQAVGQGAMFYDPRLSEVVYLNRVGQAWAWSGSDWRSLTIAGMPRLTQPGAVADSEQLLVAAGYDEGRNLLVIALPSTTWTWDGSRWSRIDGGIDLADGQSDPRAVYSSASGRLMYLGQRSIWTWDGSGWLAQPQPGLAGGTLGYDPLRKTAIVVREDTSDCDRVACAARIWSWEGTAWTLQTVAHAPAMPLTRSGATDLPMVFDEARANLVLFISAT